MPVIPQRLRVALRGLRRTPGFTAIVIATLGLGIGANAAIFSVVDGVLLRPLPFRDVDRLVELAHDDPYFTASEPEYMDYRRDLRSVSDLAAYSLANGSVRGGADPERVTLARVSSSFFSVLGVHPALGRAFAPDEELPGAAPSPVVVISHGFWLRQFGGDRSVIGKVVDLNGVARTVIGVMPAGFDFPKPAVAIWQPLRLNPDSLWTRNNHYLLMVGKLAPGRTAPRAQAEARGMISRWVRDYPNDYLAGRPLTGSVRPLTEALLGSTRPYLVALLGAVGFVLLIACANVANLLLTRGEGRRKELRIRAALGASRRELVGQLLTESTTLALLGGALGLALAWAGGRTLVSLAPSALPRLDQVAVGGRVIGFGILLSLLTGLLFGILPALRASRDRSADALRESGRVSTSHGGQRTRRILIVAEVALAVVLMAGAGLLTRSLWTLERVDLGFDPERVMTARLSLPGARYSDARATGFVRQLEERVRRLPGVRSVATMGWAPVIESGGNWSIWIDGRINLSVGEAPTAAPQQVTPDYFTTMGIALVRGRGFIDADRENAPSVTVVNEAMARQNWPGVDPIGHTLKMFDAKMPWVTVVGVVRDTKTRGPEGDLVPIMYFPYAQATQSAYFTPRDITVAVKTAGNPAAVARPLREVVHDLDPTVPTSSVMTMDAVVGTSFSGRRFTTWLLASFALLALGLASLGIYGVISYGVSRRTAEIGLRMALGAEPGAVLRLFLGDGMRLTLVGLAVGLIGALVVGRLIRSLLVGVTMGDPAVLMSVALVLLGVAALACLVPARRATAVSPTEALRGD